MKARDPTLGQSKSHQRIAMVALFYVGFYVGLIKFVIVSR